MKLSAEARAEKDAAVALENQAKFNKERGFRRVFNAMSASKLPIVGHNVMYDLLFTMAAMEQPLPDTLVEFVVSIQTSTPPSGPLGVGRSTPICVLSGL